MPHACGPVCQSGDGRGASEAACPPRTVGTSDRGRWNRLLHPRACHDIPLRFAPMLRVGAQRRRSAPACRPRHHRGRMAPCRVVDAGASGAPCPPRTVGTSEGRASPRLTSKNARRLAPRPSENGRPVAIFCQPSPFTCVGRCARLVHFGAIKMDTAPGAKLGLWAGWPLRVSEQRPRAGKRETPWSVRRQRHTIALHQTKQARPCEPACLVWIKRIGQHDSAVGPVSRRIIDPLLDNLIR